MSCCAPSITPDFAEDGGGGGGGGGGVQSVIAGTNVTVTGGSANPVINAFTSGTIVNSVAGVSGAVTLSGSGITITPSGQNITFTSSPAYPTITAGAGITVGGTAAAPVITNTNPTPVYPTITAGSGISVTGTAAAPVITNTASSGYPSITGGAGITVGGTAAAPVITNTNPTLISLNAGVGISVDNSNPLVPIITNTNPTPVYPTITAGSGISVTGTAAAPVITNTASSGYPSITGGAGITVGGTAAAPVITNTNPTLISLSAGTGISIDNSNPLVPVITNNNPTPVYPAITGGAGITVGGTAAAPVITNTNPTVISLSAGAGISIDNSNPFVPIITNTNPTPFTLNSETGAVSLTNSDSKLGITSSGGVIDITVPNIVETLNGLQGKLSLTSSTLTITPDAGTSSISIEGGGGGAITRPSFTIFVSPNGSDDAGTTGSISNPFLTIQAAINLRQSSIAEIALVEILVYAGIYNENLNITMGNIIITGYSTYPNDPPQVELQGTTLSVNPTVVEGVVTIGFTNFKLGTIASSMAITTTSSSTTGTYNFSLNNCYLLGNLVHTTNPGSRTQISYLNCNIICSNGGVSLVQNNGCLLNILRSRLEQTAGSIAVINIGSGNDIDGNMNCQLSEIICSTPSTAPAPIIVYTTDVPTIVRNYLINNVIHYTSSLPDTGTPPAKCCMQLNTTSPGSIYFDIMANNLFLCDGGIVGSPNKCIVYNNSGGMAGINYFGGNLGGVLCHSIDNGITRLSNLNDVT